MVGLDMCLNIYVGYFCICVGVSITITKKELQLFEHGCRGISSRNILFLLNL